MASVFNISGGTGTDEHRLCHAARAVPGDIVGDLSAPVE